MLFYRCFQWRCQCHRDNKSKAYGCLTFLLFRSSRRQHEMQTASLRDGGVLLFVCMSVRGGGCLSCRYLLVIVFVVIYCCRRLRHVHLRHNDDVSFWCHCSPAMSATLRPLLSTVHSQQQECTPDRQECTVDSEASEA